MEKLHWIHPTATEPFNEPLLGQLGKVFTKKNLCVKGRGFLFVRVTTTEEKSRLRIFLAADSLAEAKTITQGGVVGGGGVGGGMGDIV